MQRYLSNSKDDDPAGLYALAERLWVLVYDAAATLPGFSGEEVLIVGHSFGTFPRSLMPSRTVSLTRSLS